jgi:2-dehydropantoate 2-reductase
MRIAVIGAGGIGSYYAATLSRSGNDVRLFARGEHLDAIRARGLELRQDGASVVAHPAASDDPRSLDGCEAAIVAVKGYALESIAPLLRDVARGGATIVPLLNGVDVADRIAALGVARTSLVGGLAAVSVARPAPGVVERRSAFDRIVVGELAASDRGPTSARVAAIVAALRDAGCDASASATIQRDLWRKFAFITPMVVACGLTRGPMGKLHATEGGRRLVNQALDELAAVNRAGDDASRLSDADVARVRGDLAALPPAMRPSFLADLERGGPTEADLFTGTVVRAGRERGVPTPLHGVAADVFGVVAS